VEVIRDGQTAVYGGEATAGIINFILRTNADLSNETNTFGDDWAAAVADIFTRGNTNTTKYGNVFEGRTDIRIVPEGEYMIENIDMSLPGGDRRMHIKRQYDKEGSMFEVKDYFDCNGIQLHSQGYLTEPFGYTFPVFDIPYVSGSPIMGYRDIAPGNAFLPYRQAFDPQSWSIVPDPAPGAWQTYQFSLPECRDNGSNSTSPNIFSPSLVYLLEDSYDRFGMFGGGLNYTRMICPTFGAGIDLSYVTGKQFDWTYSRLNVMAGVEYFGFKGLRLDDPFSVSPFIYAGISNLGQKYMGNKDSETQFTAMGGVNLGYNVNDNLGIKPGAAWNPVFIENNTASNIRFTLGARFRF
jgi:hypothetical protein